MLIEQMSGRLIVYFDDPFWVGIFERVENGLRKRYWHKISTGDKAIAGAE